jgi:alkylresorcinol/alkylpyrone synthase
MYVIGLGTAVPSHRYSQAQCWEALRAARQCAALTSRSRAILKKVLLGDNAIASRHLVLAPLSEAFDLSPDTLNARFARHAPILATQAAEVALHRADTKPEEIDALLVTTCTGYLCPGLTSYVGERLGLRADVLALDLVGQGCGAALPNLRTASALLSSGHCRKALSVCVEVCSAAFFLDDDPGVLVSACLFGDGAAAAVLSGHPHPIHRRVEWKAAEGVHSPAGRECLRFEVRGGMLRNILGKNVPVLAAGHAEALLTGVLRQSGIGRSEVTGWILHAGGRDVLVALRECLGLSEADLRWSAAVLFVLARLFLFRVQQQWCAAAGCFDARDRPWGEHPIAARGLLVHPVHSRNRKRPEPNNLWKPRVQEQSCGSQDLRN